MTMRAVRPYPQLALWGCLLAALLSCGTQAKHEEIVSATDSGTLSECPQDQAMCEAICVDTTASTTHCGDCNTRCDADELCTNGACMLPPNECPKSGCPRGSYCDLAQDRCIAGCLEDQACESNEICEDRRCIVGCRDDQVCSETQQCSVLQCESCPAQRANCDRTRDDGCETNISVNDRHCGSCGTECSVDRTCNGGQCTCINGAADCAGSCVDTFSDKENCGRCGKVCPTPENGKPVCLSGSCSATCVKGYHLCGDKCVANDSVSTCGTLCTPCQAPANATALCTNEQCDFSCNSGYVRDGASCTQNCATTGCSSDEWCNPEIGLCEPGCERHAQCRYGYFCRSRTHECTRISDSRCPAGYTLRGTCSNGRQFCTHNALPDGTETVYEEDCPPNTTERDNFHCSGFTSVCIPNDE